MNLNTFGKDEKLCSQKLIGELFTSGNSFLVYPIKVIWKAVPEGLSPFPVQASFSVPKRIFKRAHDRNFLKRRMREAYRLNKFKLYEFMTLKEEKLVLMLVYVGKDKMQFQEIHHAIAKVILRLEKDVAGEKTIGNQ